MNPRSEQRDAIVNLDRLDRLNALDPEMAGVSAPRYALL